MRRQGIVVVPAFLPTLHDPNPEECRKETSLALCSLKSFLTCRRLGVREPVNLLRRLNRIGIRTNARAKIGGYVSPETPSASLNCGHFEPLRIVVEWYQ